MIKETIIAELRKKNTGNNRMAAYSIGGIFVFYFLLLIYFYYNYKFTYKFFVAAIPLTMLFGPIAIALRLSEHSNNSFYAKMMSYINTLSDDEIEKRYTDKEGNALIKCKGNKFYLPGDEGYREITTDKYFHTIKDALLGNCYRSNFKSHQ